MRKKRQKDGELRRTAENGKGREDEEERKKINPK